MSENEVTETMETLGALAADVETSLLRPLTADEVAYVPSLLARALSLIEAAAGPSSEWDEAYWVRVATVQADMVARRLRNPGGYYSESDGQYSYQFDRSVASGRLELTDDDRAVLGILQHGLFVWNPQYGDSNE